MWRLQPRSLNSKYHLPTRETVPVSGIFMQIFFTQGKPLLLKPGVQKTPLSYVHIPQFSLSPLFCTTVKHCFRDDMCIRGHTPVIAMDIHFPFIKNMEIPAQCYMAVWMGGGHGGKWTYGYVWLNSFDVHLRLSEHCWLAVSQYKNKKL